ncbi:MAG: flagellar basal body-associated protein FliL [Allosphingosinicella sp.]|uniref:flagellar basal body-associated FliL family protein n=1 Tax=Allosphingosinicella sp. TaxID=2823234 RepID=UPI00393390CA
MSEETEEGAKPKKKGKFRKIVLILVALILVGGGGAGAGLYAMGGIGGGTTEDPKKPKLVVREGVSRADADAARAAAEAGRPDPRIFQPTYLPLENSFTSNLSGGDSFVQIGLGVSTFYDDRVAANLRAHEMAVRSAVLMTLGEQEFETLSTASGKARLKEELKNAVNGVLTNKEGFGGIDEVYFTSFVTQ